MTTTCSQYATLPGMAHFPVKASILWPDEASGPWCITVWWRVQFGVPTPVGLAVTSWWGSGVHDRDELPPGGADVAFPRVEGVLLRGLPVTEIFDRTRALVRDELAARPRPVGLTDEEREAEKQRIFAERPPGDPSRVFAVAALNFAADSEETRRQAADLEEQQRALDSRRGTRDLGDDHYREVARVYSEAVQRGDPPTKAVQERFVIEKSSAAKKVARARERGFLPATTRGRTGRLEETP